MLVFADSRAHGQGKPDTHTYRYGVMLRMVREVLTNDEWKRPGWKEPGFEKQFTDLITEVAAITETKRTKLRLALPVKFADVSFAGAPDSRERDLKKILRFFSGDAKLGRVTDSIIIADGNVTLSSSYGSIIFARGAVSASGHGNLIISGHVIDASGDGFPHPEIPIRSRSLLMAGWYLNTSNSHNTICHARVEANVSGVNKTIFLNTPHVPYYRIRDYSTIYDHSFRFFDNYKLIGSQRSKRLFIQVQQDLGMVKAEWTPNPDRFLRLFFRYRGKGNTFHNTIARQGDYITDDKGQPAPGFAGWRLSFLTETHALFTKGQEDAAFRIPPPKVKIP
ncbi:MAG: hypothetical protein HYX68_19980 [Planctomycetes bacterium]|nr:hypothetical protein [Planctomycetota bacterium]